MNHTDPETQTTLNKVKQTYSQTTVSQPPV